MKKFILIFVLSIILTLPYTTLATEVDKSKGGSKMDNNQAVKLENPLGTTDPAELVKKIITAIIGITGVISLVAFVAGGITWMTSGGSAEKIKKGKDIMVWAVIGLFIVFSSYSILKYIFGAIGK